MKNLPQKVKQRMDAAKKREGRSENKVEIAALTDSLHPKIERIRKKLEKAKPDEKGLVSVSYPSLFSVHVGATSVNRVINFLNAFIISAEKRGYQTVKGIHSLVFMVDKEPLSLSVVEQTKRLKHIETDKELDAIEKWEKRQTRRRHSWDKIDWTPRPSFPEWDYEPTGKLQVKIDERSYSSDGVRRTYGDGKTQKIETLVSKIFVGLATCSAAIKSEREERERREQKWAEDARKREEQQRINGLEKKRVEALSDGLQRWNERLEILAYIAAVEDKLNTANYESPEEIKAWIEWAKSYAERINPIGDSLPALLQFDDFSSWELH